MVELDKHGLIYRDLFFETVDNAINIFKRISYVKGIILLNIKSYEKIRLYPLGLRTCNEVCRYFSRANIGFTLNPTHLVKKLIKYNNQSNYEIIDQWWRKDEQSRREY